MGTWISCSQHCITFEEIKRHIKQNGLENGADRPSLQEHADRGGTTVYVSCPRRGWCGKWIPSDMVVSKGWRHTATAQITSSWSSRRTYGQFLNLWLKLSDFFSGSFSSICYFRDKKGVPPMVRKEKWWVSMNRLIDGSLSYSCQDTSRCLSQICDAYDTNKMTPVNLYFPRKKFFRKI